MANCKVALLDIVVYIDKHSLLTTGKGSSDPLAPAKRVWHKYEVGAADMDNMRGKLTFHVSTIGLFLNSLNCTALARMDRKIDKILSAVMSSSAEDSTTSIATVSSVMNLTSDDPSDAFWTTFREELVDAGISSKDIDDNRPRIIRHLRHVVQGVQGGDLSEAADIQSILLDLRRSVPGIADTHTGPLMLYNGITHFGLKVNASILDFDSGPIISLELLATYMRYGSSRGMPACLLVLHLRSCFSATGSSVTCLLQCGFERLTRYGSAANSSGGSPGIRITKVGPRLSNRDRGYASKREVVGGTDERQNTAIWSVTTLEDEDLEIGDNSFNVALMFEHHNRPTRLVLGGVALHSESDGRYSDLDMMDLDDFIV